MRQFTVPQFIDVEDKIIGPITVRQFIIMLVGGLFVFLEYKLSDFALFLFLAIPTGLFFGVIAFVKINGAPFHSFVLNIIETFKKPSLRIWQREEKKVLSGSAAAKASLNAVQAPATAKKQPVTQSRLADLALLVDTGGVYQSEEENNNL